MVSVVRMFQRLRDAIKYAAKEESFAAIFGAGVFLVILGTITYSLAEGWNVVDALTARRPSPARQGISGLAQ